ncbi:MAG: P-loop NTPase [Arsenophonus sp.]
MIYKSTMTMNLVLALAKEITNIGIIDADIYGPYTIQTILATKNLRHTSPNKYYMVPIAYRGYGLIQLVILLMDNNAMICS